VPGHPIGNRIAENKQDYQQQRCIFFQKKTPTFRQFFLSPILIINLFSRIIHYDLLTVKLEEKKAARQTAGLLVGVFYLI
jgi:hypothetical protein